MQLVPTQPDPELRALEDGIARITSFTCAALILIVVGAVLWAMRDTLLGRKPRRRELRAEPGSPWVCGACRTSNDGRFVTCDGCGARDQA